VPRGELLLLVVFVIEGNDDVVITVVPRERLPEEFRT